VLFCCIFFPADLLQLHLYDESDASISVSDTVFNTVEEFRIVVLDASNAVYSFLLFHLLFNFSCVVFRKLDVTRQDRTSQATTCSKTVVK